MIAASFAGYSHSDEAASFAAMLGTTSSPEEFQAWTDEIDRVGAAKEQEVLEV